MTIKAAPRTFEDPVVQAAYKWWLLRRPVGWTEAEHLANPNINCPGLRDGALAKAVAVKVAACAMTIEEFTKNGVHVKITRWATGSVVECDCKCLGSDFSTHSTEQCPNLKQQLLRNAS